MGEINVLGPGQGLLISTTAFMVGKDTKLYNTNISSEPVATFDFGPGEVQFSSDGEYILLGGNEIVLSDNDGNVLFHHILRMSMDSRVDIGYRANYIAVGDLLYTSNLNDSRRLDDLDITSSEESYNPHRVPNNLSREERKAYLKDKEEEFLKKREKIKQLREKNKTSQSSNMPSAEQQYITLLSKSGNVVSEIPIPQFARRIAVSYPDCKYVGFANHNILYIYSQSGDSICTYTDDNPRAYISSLAISDEGMICAIINESRYNDNKERRLALFNLNGNLYAEQPLLDLKAVNGNLHKLSIYSDSIMVNDKAEQSIFRIISTKQ